MDNKMARIN